MFGLIKKKPKTRRYHFVITVMSPRRYGSFSNTIEWSGTRKEAFDKIFDDACADAECDPTEAYVTHWSFELDELS